MVAGKSLLGIRADQRSPKVSQSVAYRFSRLAVRQPGASPQRSHHGLDNCTYQQKRDSEILRPGTSHHTSDGRHRDHDLSCCIIWADKAGAGHPTTVRVIHTWVRKPGDDWQIVSGMSAPTNAEGH